MTLHELKIEALDNLIADLPDTMQNQASYLKEYFDRNPNQLKEAYNTLLDTLEREGAGVLGFESGGGLAGGTVQQVVERLYQRVLEGEARMDGKITQAAVGDIPDGSIGTAKLAPEVTEALDKARELPAVKQAVEEALESMGGSQAGVFRYNGEILPTVAVSNPLPASAGWYSGADVPTAHARFCSAVCNGELYMMGTTGVPNLFQGYNPVTNIWTVHPDPISGVTNYRTLTTVGEKIYYFWQPQLFAYNTRLKTWSTLTSNTIETTSAMFHNTAGVGNECFFMGGATAMSATTSLNTVYIYNTLTDTWRQGANMLTSVVAAATVAVGTKIYLFGGSIGPSATSAARNAAMVYDTVANSWGTLATMPESRSYARACAVGNNIYIMGGATTGVYNSLTFAPETIMVYNIPTNTYSYTINLPTKRAWAAAGTINDKIVVAGGSSDQGVATAKTDILSFGVNEGVLIGRAAAGQRMASTGLVYTDDGETVGTFNSLQWVTVNKDTNILQLLGQTATIAIADGEE